MRSTRDKGECPQVAVPTVTGSTHDVREYPQWWLPMIVGSNGECLQRYAFGRFSVAVSRWLAFSLRVSLADFARKHAI
jgi:hypothetical protein